MSAIQTAVLGFPRIGRDRELKGALERYWAGGAEPQELLETAAGIRGRAWSEAREAGIDVIPSGDHSLYDHVLDAAWALGVLPERDTAADPLAAYFAAARGSASRPALELTKWLDTNYHYLVPELHAGQAFELDASHWLRQLEEAAALGIATRPVVLGPLSFLLLSKGLAAPLGPLDRLVPVYAELLAQLAAAGAREVQLDEPCLVADPPHAALEALAPTYRALRDAGPLELCLATYFGRPDADTLRSLLAAPVAELHLDLVRAPGLLEQALPLAGGELRLSLGLVDGRNVWRTDPDQALRQLDAAVEALGFERVRLATACSLLHVPYAAAREQRLDPELGGWLAFGDEKLRELALLASAAERDSTGRDAVLGPAREVAGARRGSARVADPAVRSRLAGLDGAAAQRRAPLTERAVQQGARLGLPELPTTTIGSFPQTAEIRRARRDHRAGRLDDDGYRAFLEREIAESIETQEQIGLDVLVHGEPERSDMVEYFGEHLAGFAITDHGWVQSYGSRCVRPPVLYGDVSRRHPITLDSWRYAQSRTTRPVKGMLTGPVTILQWSFVRDDQPRAETCAQIALALREEVLDLEAAGAAIVQVDEPALREGLPLRADEHAAYLRWAVDCFRLVVSGVRPDTQVHTHMCYAELGDVLPYLERMDADVISLEASRSHMEVLDELAAVDYRAAVGPGVYDIHSPQVPSAAEIGERLALAEQRIERSRLWVNPDCGLKTRRWEEVEPALRALVAAARSRR
jgi:5-methyltetrahydropteroyltriglutamate--homocysteine methyltransferase